MRARRARVARELVAGDVITRIARTTAIAPPATSRIARPTRPERVTTMPVRYEPEVAGLREYQAPASRWLATQRRALLADDMRLGKCAETLRALPPHAPTLILCPNVVRFVWRDEVRRWRRDLRPLVGELAVPGSGDVVIIAYEALPAEVRGWRRLLEASLRHVHGIFDEVHWLKSPTALRTRRARLLGAQLLTLWGLTGTPMLGYAEEFWEVLATCGLARRVATRQRFLEAFHQDGAQFVVDDEIRERIGRVMLRRTRTDVRSQLPGRIFQRVPVPAPHRLRDDRIDPEARAELARSRIPAALDLARQLLADGAPLVIFSSHVEPMLAMAELGAGVVTGEETAERGGVIERFRRGELQCIALTNRTAGIGIDLSRASRILEIDRDWSPAVNDQAYSRCEAMTKDEALLILQMVSEHAIDRRVDELLLEKTARIDAVLAPSRTLGNTGSRSDP